MDNETKQSYIDFTEKVKKYIPVGWKVCPTNDKATIWGWYTEYWDDIPDTNSEIREFTHYKDGLYHNEPGPANIETWHMNSSIVYCVRWFLNGKHHRIGGPAHICMNGSMYYFIRGKRYEEKEYWNHPDVLEHKLSKLLSEE